MPSRERPDIKEVDGDRWRRLMEVDMDSDSKFAAGLEPRLGGSVHSEGHSSGVSWGAVIGGAFATASFSLILLALGAGMGLSSVSPWANVGASTSTFGT